MEDALAVVNRIIEWHQTIRGHVKLVGDSISDREALLTVAQTSPEWIPGQLESLDEKQKKLQQAVSLLEDGLSNHFDFEEKALPTLLGELFMKALRLEHQEVRDTIGRVKTMAVEMKTGDMSRDELLTQEAEIQQAIGDMCQLIEEHANREEAMLDMLRRALQSESA